MVMICMLSVTLTPVRAFRVSGLNYSHTKAAFIASTFVVAMGFVMSTHKTGYADVIVTTGSTWKATSASPSSGWNTSTSYDDTSWENATPAGVILPNTIWLGPYLGGPSEVWFRQVFDPSAGTAPFVLNSWFDDDGELFINGAQVVLDQSGLANNVFNVDVSSYLTAGQNVIAAHVVNHQGNGLFAATLTAASPAVPEPSTYAMALAGLACGGYSMFRRRRAR
jgi:hypothetical protein